MTGPRVTVRTCQLTRQFIRVHDVGEFADVVTFEILVHSVNFVEADPVFSVPKAMHQRRNIDDPGWCRGLDDKTVTFT